jgi:5-methyltetrahydropteroyltriglutamate--homocysteine methyltransferase
MKRSEQRILTTHVGSLIRPGTLLDAAKDRDPAHRGAYERELKGAVADVVSRQAKAGIDVVNDGEFGKPGWANYSLERLSGFEPRPDKLYPAVWLGRDRIRFADFMAAEFPRGTVGSPGHACVGPIAYQGHASVRRDLDNLRSAAAAADVEEVFFTAVAPASVGYDAANEYYPDERDYVFAIAKALREEYLEVHKAGFVRRSTTPYSRNYDHLVEQSPQRYREWASCGSRRFQRWRHSRIASAITSASAAGTCLMSPTLSSRTSSI